jgi:CheY-like chemotaxis protein
MSQEVLELSKVLIVEDGDEYLSNLSRFVPGPNYLQAHSGSECLDVLRSERADLIYLDMRFDRIDRALLLGDHAAVTHEHNGDPERGWRYLQNHQGLFILREIKTQGYGDLPVVLSYDFSREARRFVHLKQGHPNLTWIGDDASPEQIKRTLLLILQRSP